MPEEALTSFVISVSYR